MLAAVDGDGLAVIVTRGSTSPFDCGAFLKRASVAGKGRGGGRPERARAACRTTSIGRTFVSCCSRPAWGEWFGEEGLEGADAAYAFISVKTKPVALCI
jgi:hypothetical protein